MLSHVLDTICKNPSGLPLWTSESTHLELESEYLLRPQVAPPGLVYSIKVCAQSMCGLSRNFHLHTFDPLC